MTRLSKALSLGLIAFTGACNSSLRGSETVEKVTSALEAAPNDRGFAESFHTSGVIDRTNPFFTPNGGNGRTCETCHLSNQGWTITPSAVTELFNATDGLDLLFKTLDEGS